MGTQMRMMKQAGDALNIRVNNVGGQVTGGFTDAQVEAVRNRLAALQNPDEGAVRLALEAELGAANVNADMVRRVHQWTRGQLTPTGTVGSSPTGTRTPINPSDSPENILAYTRENESADILAARGYRVEQNPAPPAGSTRHPDYLIEGQYFDCVAPTTSRVRNVASRIQEKVDIEQARRIVVNLTDSNVTIQELRNQLSDWPIPNLEEVIVIQDGQIILLFP